jgi:flagellar biosynthesis chaperone FliJ
MKLSEQFKKQLQQVETSLEKCQQILAKKSEEEETNEWLENWSRWVN